MKEEEQEQWSGWRRSELLAFYTRELLSLPPGKIVAADQLARPLGQLETLAAR